MEHDRAYHRFKDKVKQKRRIEIIRRLWSWKDWDYIKDNATIGKLVDGKVHCSCPECSPKFRRDGMKISEKRKMKGEE